jgi:hypothetical protein
MTIADDDLLAKVEARRAIAHEMTMSRDPAQREFGADLLLDLDFRRKATAARNLGFGPMWQYRCRCARRKQALIHMRRTYFSHLNAASAARAVLDTVEGYGLDGWKRDRTKAGHRPEGIQGCAWDVLAWGPDQKLAPAFDTVARLFRGLEPEILRGIDPMNSPSRVCQAVAQENHHGTGESPSYRADKG